LQTTNLSIYRISELCGFKNQRRFAETFRRKQGTTPRTYRNGTD
jgi:transcriptional regulator GlxA family with amidase domain